MPTKDIQVNRAPVMTLWAAVVAERLGHDQDAALTLGDLTAVQAALEALAQAYPPDHLAARAYALYEQFRPAVPEGTKGWGAKGDLRLDTIRALARKGRGEERSTARLAKRGRSDPSPG